MAMSELVEKLIATAYLFKCNDDKTLATFKQVVTECKNAGIDPSIELRQQNVLMIGARIGSDILVEYLLGLGLNPNLRTRPGYTPLMEITEWNDSYARCVKLLFKHGANIYARTAESDTILHCVCNLPKICMIEYAKILLDKGIDPNAKNQSGETVLHELCSPCFDGRDQPNFLEFVKLMLDRGADPNVPDKHGTTPLMLACMDPFLDCQCVQLLLDRGANPNVHNDRHTVLSNTIVSFSGHLSVVLKWDEKQREKAKCIRMLLDHGTRITRCDMYFARCNRKYYTLIKEHHEMQLLTAVNNKARVNVNVNVPGPGPDHGKLHNIVQDDKQDGKCQFESVFVV